MERRIDERELAHADTDFWVAQASIATASPLPPVRLPTSDTLGKTSSTSVRAPREVPGFFCAAMDGYAVRAQDCRTATAIDPTRLPVVGTVQSGGGLVACPPQSAVKVMTGARVPEGADAVVPWEHTDLGAAVVAIRVAPDAGHNVRAPGDQVAAGQVIVPAGAVVGPAHISAAVAAGVSALDVVPAPRVAILTTGDELVGDGISLAEGQVTDSNGPLLAAFVAQHGAQVAARVRVGDDPAATRRAMLALAAGADLLVTTGGVSVGEADWVRDALEDEGEVTFWRVAMRPGRPIAYGRLGTTPVLCLPGTPSGVLAGAYLFLGPLLEARAGRAPRPRSKLPTREPLPGLPGRVQLLPGWIDGSGGFCPLEDRHPGLGRLAAAADGLAIVESTGAQPGDHVDFVAFTR